MSKEAEKDPSAPTDAQWREMCRECNARSREWTEEDRNAFGEGWSHTPSGWIYIFVVLLVGVGGGVGISKILAKGWLLGSVLSVPLSSVVGNFIA
ncbi:hypothetical protein QZM64_39540 [Burkholderia cepacia]|uniref:hypothetical protein n=1 Tax=Burkholderia cepacia TaxID=292 RepID=UPI0026519FD4|nr:hypothetical protein [Burkholderia cepacia]MDN7445265.1 hypothetical protein [Burkholderia cepacia]